MCTKTCGLCELSLTDEEIQAKFNFSRGSLAQEELVLDKLSTTRRVRSVSGSATCPRDPEQGIWACHEPVEGFVMFCLSVPNRIGQRQRDWTTTQNEAAKQHYAAVVHGKKMLVLHFLGEYIRASASARLSFYVQLLVANAEVRRRPVRPSFLPQPPPPPSCLRDVVRVRPHPTAMEVAKWNRCVADTRPTCWPQSKYRVRSGHRGPPQIRNFDQQISSGGRKF